MTVAGKKWSQGTGPRFPSPTGYEDIADPANGEPARRCWHCGLPDQPDNRVLVFGLTVRGLPVGRWQLCERSYSERNPRDPRDGDPLRAA